MEECLGSTDCERWKCNGILLLWTGLTLRWMRSWPDCSLLVHYPTDLIFTFWFCWRKKWLELRRDMYRMSLLYSAYTQVITITYIVKCHYTTWYILVPCRAYLPPPCPSRHLHDYHPRMQVEHHPGSNTLSMPRIVAAARTPQWRRRQSMVCGWASSVRVPEKQRAGVHEEMTFLAKRPMTFRVSEVASIGSTQLPWTVKFPRTMFCLDGKPSLLPRWKVFRDEQSGWDGRPCPMKIGDSDFWGSSASLMFFKPFWISMLFTV